jgi:6-phosphofructo-2-kinase/fructose-2,6-biphosphatase 2/6-phosphofructo-2-kinase/fructose-2,6-biphosphatase 4
VGGAADPAAAAAAAAAAAVSAAGTTDPGFAAALAAAAALGIPPAAAGFAVQTTRPHVLVIAMVGLPARGKSYIAMKLWRYLRWLRYDCALFSVSKYRREEVGTGLPLMMGHPDEAAVVRAHVTKRALDGMAQFFAAGGKIGIFDASNVNVQRRDGVRAYLRALGLSFSLLWVESVCTDEALVESNILDTKLYSPDYAGVDEAEAVSDFKRRIDEYARHYQPMTEPELEQDVEAFVRLIDTGLRMQCVSIKGYLLTKIVFFLMNLQVSKSPIYFSRHGESQANVNNQVGTDAPLSVSGQAYAERLAAWLVGQGELAATATEVKPLNIYCSTLQRTIITAQRVYDSLSRICACRVVKWRALAEISAGIYDGMTYEEIAEADPEGFEERNRDKLNYKYPQGESYKDVIDRVERVIFELERTEAPVVVIAHQAVIRCLYGYFMDYDINDIPHLEVPLHKVIKLLPHAYGTREEVIDIMPETRRKKH